MATFGEQRLNVSNLLSGFHAISVRDDNSSQIISNECGLSSTRLLDPTWLIDFAHMKEKSTFKVKYVLVYGKCEVEEMLAIAQWAHAESCKVFSVGYRNIHADKNLTGIGVEEWVGMVRTAKAVFTSFYHGVIFSLKFHRKVYVVPRPDKEYKINQLTNDLDLTEDVVTLNGLKTNKPEFKRLAFSSRSESLVLEGRDNAANFLNNALST